jgi:hypothetical protein
LGNVITARLAPHIAPRWLIIGGGVFVLGAMLFGSTLTRTIPYFPDLLLPILIGGFGIGVISVILPLCAVAEVGPSEIGPVSAVTLMVQNLGGPVVLVVIQAVQVSRTLYLGGTTGAVLDPGNRSGGQWWDSISVTPKVPIPISEPGAATTIRSSESPCPRAILAADSPPMTTASVRSATIAVSIACS